MRHLLDPMDLTVEEIYKLIEKAQSIKKNPMVYSNIASGKILATLFYEPSTRTRLSFESAMYRLGGNVIGFATGDSSSATKGETPEDTLRMISCYADICAMRHPQVGVPHRASKTSTIPLINAGDGGHQHPTQTLTDLLTIYNLKNKLTGLKVGFCGDLKYGRTVHSLVKAMSRYEGTKFVFISPVELRLQEDIIRDYIEANNIEYQVTDSIEEGIKDLDILYMTRIQGERFDNVEEYDRLKDVYILNEEKLALAKEDMIVMHPLPRVNEISVEVDSDPRAKYFYQAHCGVYIRMALILKLLDIM